MFVTFEQSTDALQHAVSGLSRATSFKEPVAVLDARPSPDAASSGGTIDIRALLAILGAHVREHRTQRLVLDGLDTLFERAGSLAAMPAEYDRLVRFADDNHLTTLVCLRAANAEDQVGDAMGPLEYAADASIRLYYRSVDGLRERLLRIVKIRGYRFAEGDIPFVMGDGGLEVLFAQPERSAPAHRGTRVSTGVADLDRMLDGGIGRGTVTLISGRPGTAKSTLGAAALAATLRRGEPALLVAFDESADELVDNVRSVGIDLRARDLGAKLHLLSLNARAEIAHVHVRCIERALLEHGARIVVIDPVNALEKSGGSDIAARSIEYLSDAMKRAGATAFFTAVGARDAAEAAPHVSTIADTWIHLDYGIINGERNRTLTIIKSRGTEHSNHVREFALSADGFRLIPASRLGGQFLVGSARAAREVDARERIEQRERVAAEIAEAHERKALAYARLQQTEREMREIDECLNALLIRNNDD